MRRLMLRRICRALGKRARACPGDILDNAAARWTWQAGQARWLLRVELDGHAIEIAAAGGALVNQTSEAA